MNKDDLMPGESLLTYSENGLVTLTTHRIRYANKIWGQSNMMSIMLEKISSIQVVYISYPFLWVMGALVGLIGIIMLGNGRVAGPELIIIAFVAFFLIMGYFLSRRHICSITSDGGTKIIFRTENMATERLIDLMNKIEEAKADRLLAVNKEKF